MAGENLTNSDGALKDSYTGKVTSQTGKGFQKLTPFRRRIKSQVKKNGR